MATGIGVSSPFIGGDGRPLLEPGALFVDGNYALRVNAWCSVVGVTVALRSRFLRSGDGELVDSDDDLAVTSNRVLTTHDNQLTAGFPLNVQVFALAGTPTIGQCFVQVQIVRGRGPAAIPIATVLQGYITATQALSWPGSPISNSFDGAGAAADIIFTVPGVGADFAQVVPGGARWQIVTVTATYSASAVAGNRAAVLQLTDGVHTFVRSPDVAFMVASNVYNLSWMSGLGGPAVGPLNTRGLSLPVDAFLSAGNIISSQTTGILGGDQWFGPIATVREWLDV